MRVKDKKRIESEKGGKKNRISEGEIKAREKDRTNERKKNR